MDTTIPPDRYQRIFEALPGAFLLLLPDAGFTIAGVSDAYLHATLRRREDVMGRRLFDVFPDNPDTPDAHSTLNLSRSLARVVAGRKADVMAIQRYDVAGVAGGFEMRYWSPVNAPVFGDDGELLCIVHRVDNVTDYVRLSEEHERQAVLSDRLGAETVKMKAEIVERSRELDRLNDELRKAYDELSLHARRALDDSARKDEFLAMLAHELRNPLAAMSSALQLWSMAPADARRQQGLLEICRRQVRNLTRLTDDLLEMSRIDRGAVALQQAPLDLRDIVESALHAVRDLFEQRRLNIVTHVAPADFTAFGDATRLEQALTNLLANAAKYCERGGHVALRLETAGTPAGWARIVVEDDGRGIPPDKLEAIFDIFVQVDVSVDRSRGGLGIGLSLVRAIVGLHGGRVRAESAGIGSGSRFIVELPLLAAADRRRGDGCLPAQPPAAMPQAPGTPLRIVVVEDNPDARDTLCGLLGAFGYAVTAAADGREGLHLIVTQAPDLAIVDLGLPELDGFEVARRVRSAVGPAVKLVALTGYSAPAVQAAALEAGFDMHVVKPCTPAKLAEILAP